MTDLSTLGEETVIILAPTGRDALISAEILNKSQIAAEIVPSAEALCNRLTKAAGILVIAEEALTPENCMELKNQLEKQEAWSEIPIVLLTSEAQRIFNTQNLLDCLIGKSSISILERPFRIITFINTIYVALQFRKRQYQVRDLLKQQKEGMRKRDEFVSIASHELKTPITSLKLQLEMARLKLKPNENNSVVPNAIANALDMSNRQLARLLALVDNLLDVTRIESGKMDLNFEKIDLCEHLKEVLDRYRDQLKAADCALSFFTEPCAPIECDRFRIEQVFTNLLTNAMKYGAGKPIEVKIENLPEGARFSIKDHGIGIPRDMHIRVFDRFERAVASNHISGLGLGLYISRQIVLGHKGSIEVESELQQGSTFIVQLPREQKGSTQGVFSTYQGEIKSA